MYTYIHHQQVQTNTSGSYLFFLVFPGIVHGQIFPCFQVLVTQNQFLQTIYGNHADGHYKV